MDPTIPETERYRKFLSEKYIEFLSDKDVQNFFKFKSYDLDTLDNSRSILSISEPINNIGMQFLKDLEIDLRGLHEKYEDFKNKPIVIHDPIEILSDDDDDDLVIVEENNKPYVFIEKIKWKMPKKIPMHQKPSSSSQHHHNRPFAQVPLQSTSKNVAQVNIEPMQQQQIQQANVAPVQIQQQVALANNQVPQNNQLQQQVQAAPNWPLVQQMNPMNMFAQIGMMVTKNMITQQMQQQQQQLSLNILQQQQQLSPSILPGTSIQSAPAYNQQQQITPNLPAVAAQYSSSHAVPIANQQQQLSPNLLLGQPLQVSPPLSVAAPAPIISQNKPPHQNLSQIPVRPSHHGNPRFSNNRNIFRPPHRSNNNTRFNHPRSANPRQNDPRINRAYPVDRERDEREKKIALTYVEHKRLNQEKERKRKEEEERKRQINIERAKKLREINKKHQEEKAVEEKQNRKSRWDDNSAALETIQQREQTKSKELQQQQQTSKATQQQQHSDAAKQQQASKSNQQQMPQSKEIKNSNTAKATHELQQKQPIKEIPQQTSKATQQQLQKQPSQITQQREQTCKVIQQQQSLSLSQKQQSSTLANKPAASSSAQNKSKKENNQQKNNESAVSKQMINVSKPAREISEISKQAKISENTPSNDDDDDATIIMEDKISSDNEISNDAAENESSATMQEEEDSRNLVIKEEVKVEIDDRSMSSGATNDSKEDQEFEAVLAKKPNYELEQNIEAAIAEVPNIEFQPAETANQSEPMFVIKKEIKEEQVEEESYHGSDLASTNASEVPEVANDAENESFYEKLIAMGNDREFIGILSRAMPRLEEHAMSQLEDLNQQAVTLQEKCQSWIENVGSVSPNYDQPSDESAASENDNWSEKGEFFTNDEDEDEEIIPYQPNSQISSPRFSQSQ